MSTNQDNYDARIIANALLDIADEQNRSLSITSLLKILYFSHGWYLAKYDKNLIAHEFEAWQHGPVIRVVYDQFKDKSGSIINTRAKIFNPATATFEIGKYNLSKEILNFLRIMVQGYSKYHPYELSEMTHEINSPWDIVWKNAEQNASPGMRISHDSIKHYFLRLNKSDIFRN